MNFEQYLDKLQEELKSHNLTCMPCVAREFFLKDYSIDEAVLHFLKYKK